MTSSEIEVAKAEVLKAAQAYVKLRDEQAAGVFHYPPHTSPEGARLNAAVKVLQQLQEIN